MDSVSQLLQLSVELQSTSDSPQLDCELLLCHVLDVDRTWLRTWPDSPVTKDQKALFEVLLHKRCQGHPIAYLVGSRGFWSIDLKVSSETLIPRPETELIVELALNLNFPSHACGLDLGTGSGAIALALASERPDMQWLAVDSQQGAVELAQTNCDRLKLTNVNVFHSVWFNAMKAPNNRFDLIVSNPPYVAVDDPHLVQGDVRFEPSSALVAGVDGLDDIKIIVSQSPAYLNSNGWLLIEHGYNQGQAVSDLMLATGFSDVFTHQDYNDLDRVTLGQLK
jgi:release factor glutamine methyltransferase